MSNKLASRTGIGGCAMTSILLSSRAFVTDLITHTFFELMADGSKNRPVVIIVNSVKEGKQHPKMIALKNTLIQKGVSRPILFDVYHDDVAVLKQAAAIILNGGYEFFLLHSLKESGMDQVFRTLILKGVPTYGISAGAIVLGPDLGLYQVIYPEDNLFHDKDISGLHVTDIRIYPHYDQHLAQNPTLAEKISKWETATHNHVIRIANDEGVVIRDNAARRFK